MLSNFRQFYGRFTVPDFKSVGAPTLVLLILALLVVPLPAFLLDVLFTFNIMLGLLMVMITINTRMPLEFSSFPSVLLITTLLRLGLNVASTRVVLVEGHTGTDAAGKVIESFGEFVIAGNYVVGFIIFLILMIINFIVVTKGAGRVSEVIARFTLDAMPGKQMAIDADLNAGIIDQEAAKKRRAELTQESDFYGSMDGASKFVRGDAIAGILILIINIVGGLIVGTTQHELSLTEAGRIYVLLTIGDGLVAQIPSLLLSLATAILVTRVTTEESMAEQASRQVADPNAVFIASGIVTLLGLIPGMPHFVFLPLGAAGIGLGFHLRRVAEDERTEIATAQAVAEVEPAARELGWDDIDQVEVIALDIGYGLVPLANTQSGGQLLTRIRGIRKKLSAELGFLIQPIRIRDNLDLKPEVYQISLHGVVRGSGDVRVGKLLAINGSDVPAPLDGEPTKEPAFGLDAIWIDSAKAELARGLGYTVVDAPTAIATHINAVIRDNASELLGQDETQQLLDKVATRYPKLVSNLVPDLLPLSTVTQVLQNLLTENVPVKDMRNIIDALTAHAKENHDPTHLTTLVRPKLGRLIVQPLVDDSGSLTVITLAPDLEKLLESSRGASGGEHITLDPTLANSMIESLKNEAEKIQDTGQVATLVVSPTLRSWMSRFVRVRVPDLSVLSYTEIPDDQRINVQSSIGGEAAIENETE
ncbi:MAG: flagellar biosynthesis protein FlhA [Proteobacteria bacterium]|nr:flagellar biosynthesis protein FlhA [Pseudomonadota bacterium]